MKGLAKSISDSLLQDEGLMVLIMVVALFVAAVAVSWAIVAWLGNLFGRRKPGWPPQPPPQGYRPSLPATPPPTILMPGQRASPKLREEPTSVADVRNLSAREQGGQDDPQRATPPAPVIPASVPDLALGTFAPISVEEMRQQAGNLDWRANFTFGRRDLIPPVSDPRTLLIDKALVAHGLLTPEDLAEIHRVGLAMDQVRPDLYVAQAQARQSIDHIEQDRQRLKAEKKRQAEERRRLHAEAVAQRRAADIVFLGRGVSSALSDRQSDVDKLAAQGLPVLATPADVAAALSVPIPRLRWLAFHSEAASTVHYVRFTVPKRSGGTRQLWAPHEQLAQAQEWILRNILDKVAPSEPAHGFVAGRSIVTNARPHVGADVVVNADLQDFFPTISFVRVRGIFRHLGYSPAVATVLALLCTEAPRRTVSYAGKTFHVATGPRALPQGACTSPTLSNLAVRRLDSRLAGLARKLGWTYTRYADDMSFSAKGDAAATTLKVGYVLARLRHIAGDEGFTVNEAKTRVLKRASRQTVTGVVVNQRPGVPRDLYKRLRAILHRARHEGLERQNRQNLPHFKAWLRGMIAYVNMVNPTQGQRLSAAMDALEKGGA